MRHSLKESFQLVRAPSPGEPAMRLIPPTRRAVLAGALALPACAGRAAPMRDVLPKPSFADDFTRPLSLYHPAASPQGRWKTNYWFADQSDYAGAASRSLPGEKQLYVDPTANGVNPFHIRDGILEIRAEKSPRSDPGFASPYPNGLIAKGAPFPYTSGLITTERSFRQRYGYFEARMAFPRGRGLWPAFWLLPETHDDATHDEIDVVEWVGVEPNRLLFTAHGPENGGSLARDDFTSPYDFHTYGLLWTPKRLVWYVDQREVRTVTGHHLHRPMYMLLNLAVGGWDGNDKEDPSVFPATLRVDSVRAFGLRPGVDGQD
jgi:beta-glucanase (GH16 family)